MFVFIHVSGKKKKTNCFTYLLELNLKMGNGGDQVILATGGYDHSIKFWQAHSGVCQRTVQHPDSQVNALDITPDSQLIAAAGYQHIRMYEINSSNPNPIVNYEGISRNVTTVGFHEDGHWMYTGGEDCSARVWDLRSRSLQCQRIFQVSAPVNCVCLHPNQGELLVGDQSGVIHIWDLRTDHNEQLIPEQDASIQHISIDSSANFMAAINNKGNCYVWSLSAGSKPAEGEDGPTPTQLRPRSRLLAHKRYGLKCKFSPDAKYLATTSADQTVKLWRTSDFSLHSTLQSENQRWVWDIAFSADSQYAITASSDGTARLWSIETSEIAKEYIGHQKALTSLAFQDGTP